MSRRKIKTIDNAIGKITPNKNAAFFRVYEPLLYSKAFLKLTPNARLLYMAMGLSAKGRERFTFPHSAYTKLVSKDSFVRARSQLIESGFIVEMERYRTRPTVYSLSSDWMTRE